MRMCGTALPIRCPAGDNLWIHRALDEAKPGDVLVVDVGEGIDFGYWGEIMATAALARGLAGLVISGGIRDSNQLVELGLPTFSASISMRGTLKNERLDGAVGEPVRMGEITVRRGDLVLGDCDGVVALSPELAAEGIPAAEHRDAAEVKILEQVRNGARVLDVYKL